MAVGLGLLLGTVVELARAATVVIVVLYVISTAAAAIRYRDRTRRGSAAALLVVYPTLHLAYGLGMISGFIRFVVRGSQRSAVAPEIPDV